MNRVIRLGSLALVGVIGLTGCGSSTDSNDPLADGVLTVGMEADYAPYNWTTNEANASEYAYPISGSDALADGYDVRMAEALADELGVELEIVKMSWDGRKSQESYEIERKKSEKKKTKKKKSMKVKWKRMEE